MHLIFFNITSELNSFIVKDKGSVSIFLQIIFMSTVKQCHPSLSS